MTIGYMTIEINKEGEPRIKKDRNGQEMLTFLDINYEYTTEIKSEALEMIRASIPKELKDVLVFFTFKYESSGGGGFYTDDYEDWLTIESQVVLKEDYQAFYRHQVTTEMEMMGAITEGTAENWGIAESEMDIKKSIDMLIGEWEEFYDEEFTPTVVEKVAVEPLQYFNQ